MPSEFFEIPQEFLDSMREQAVHVHMTAEARRLDVKHFFDELTPKQISVFLMLVDGAASEGSRYGAYLVGVASGVMMAKYEEYCPGCGTIHDEDILSDISTETVPEKKPEAKKAFPEPELVTESDIVSLNMDGSSDSFKDQTPEEDRDYVALLEEYNVADVSGKIICKGCGAISQSLVDRMIREPGVKGCSGCQQKAKWG